MLVCVEPTYPKSEGPGYPVELFKEKQQNPEREIQGLLAEDTCL